MAEGTATQVLAGEADWSLHHGDCLEMLRALPDNSIDSLVTDPPAGISFMQRDWDGAKGGREQWVAWLTEIMRETLRVLKPGAHGVVWALPRTAHWTGAALEDAGFEIRDSIQHVFGSGFGKSKSARRALAMKLCALPGRHFESSLPKGPKAQEGDHVCANHADPGELDGFGTGLAPSHEVWFLIRKPLDGTLAENLLKWGTGAINIDGCRIAHASADDLAAHQATVASIKDRGGTPDSWKNASDLSGANDVSLAGRWPKNTVFSHSPGCVRVGTRAVAANPTWDTPNRATEPSSFTGGAVSKVRHANGRHGEATAEQRYTDRGATNFAPLPGQRRGEEEEVEVWDCVKGCAVRELDEQSGELTSGTHERHGKSMLGVMNDDGWEPPGRVTTGHDKGGTASRFFMCFSRDEDLDDIASFIYAAKPSRREKDLGLDHFRPRTAAELTDSEEDQARLNSPRTGGGRTGGARNPHPTPKGTKLIRYFTRLVSPPRAVVLDLFSGSGTGGVSARAEGFRFIGAELMDSDEEPFVSVARARINHVEGRTFVPRESLRAAEPPRQGSLW